MLLWVMLKYLIDGDLGERQWWLRNPAGNEATFGGEGVAMSARFIT